MVCPNFILPEACKPCLFLSSFQFAHLIVLYLPASHDLVSTFSGGVIVCARKDNSFSACIVDIDGNEIQADNIERERINEYVFCDGYAYDEKNLCFIGTDGNPLELYIGQ